MPITSLIWTLEASSHHSGAIMRRMVSMTDGIRAVQVAPSHLLNKKFRARDLTMNPLLHLRRVCGVVRGAGDHHPALGAPNCSQIEVPRCIEGAHVVCEATVGVRQGPVRVREKLAPQCHRGCVPFSPEPVACLARPTSGCSYRREPRPRQVRHPDTEAPAASWSPWLQR